MPTAFRYFDRPHAFSMYREEPRACDLCGEERPGYNAGAFASLREIEHVCEECLTVGRLEEAGLSTNEGDHAALKCQLALRHPDLREEERERIAQARTVELEQRTPAIVSWQPWFWPAHCGDYCRYVKEVGQPELVRLAPDGDGVAFLATHGPDISDIDHARDVWPGIRPDVPTNARNAYAVGVYLFRCLVCGAPILMWDSD